MNAHGMLAPEPLFRFLLLGWALLMSSACLIVTLARSWPHSVSSPPLWPSVHSVTWKGDTGEYAGHRASKPVPTQLHALPPVAPGTGTGATPSLPTPDHLFCNTEVVLSASKCHFVEYKRPVVGM